MAIINWKTFHQAESNILKRALRFKGWRFTKSGHRAFETELKKFGTMRSIAFENWDSELTYLQEHK